MRKASLRTWLISALTTLCLLLSIAAMNVGSAHAAQIKHGLPKGVVPFVDPNAVLTQVNVTFLTHDDNKDFDTSIAFLMQERINAFLVQDLARGNNLANGTEFVDRSLHTLSIPLVTTSEKLSDLVNAPTYRITMTPVGNDTWIFDVTVTLVFSDGSQFSSQTANIHLDQDHRVFSGVFS